MLFDEFKKYVEETDFRYLIKKNKLDNIKRKKIEEDIKTILTHLHKYLYDLDLPLRKKICEICIKYWKNKNTKIDSKNNLEIIKSYIFDFSENSENYDTHDITVAGNYNFTYINYNKKNIRPENIFKLNFQNIIDKLKTYFPEIKINIFFEKSTCIDKEIKKSTYKHDVKISISQKDNNSYDNSDDGIDDLDIDNIKNGFEMVLEYFEEKHNRFNDDDKYISTKIFADKYFVFSEKDDDMNEFMIDTIYNLIELICASTNDEYELSKILYFNKNNKNKNLIRHLEYFNNIINIQKNNKFNFEDFYKSINPCDVNTEKKISQKKFIKLLEEEQDYGIEINIDDDGYCDAETFNKIIMFLDSTKISSPRIRPYKNIYINALNTLRFASKRIIEILKEQRDNKAYLPQFVKNIQKFHVKNLKNII